MARAIRAEDQAGERGAALFIVLLFAALVSSLAGTSLRGALSGVRAAATFVDTVRADELGRAAAPLIGYAIATGGPEARRGGAFTAHVGEADVAVTYVSEAARVDANTGPTALIAALLAAAGADPDLVAAATARIDAIRAKAAAIEKPPADAAPGIAPDGAMPPPSPPADAPAAPAHPAIQSTLDVPRAWALPADVARRILPALTIANRSAQVDPVLAGPLVVKALMSGDETRAHDYIERRAQGFADMEGALALLPVDARPLAGFGKVDAVHALVRVTIPPRFVRRYDIILDIPPDGTAGGTILSWRPVY